MRVILVTFSDILPVIVTKCLSSELEYRAIIVDDTKSAKEFIKNIGSNENLIYPYSELKNCIDNFHCDIVISVGDWTRGGYVLLPLALHDCGVEKNKAVHFLSLHTVDNFFMERALRYFKENQTFEMFATGMSHVEGGILPQFFRKKLFNFGRGAQDLYFDYKIAKFILDTTHGGGGQYSIRLDRISPLRFSLRFV